MKVWQINGSANGLFIVSTNLDGFSLANHGRFAKFAKLSHYTVCSVNSINNLTCALYACICSEC